MLVLVEFLDHYGHAGGIMLDVKSLADVDRQWPLEVIKRGWTNDTRGWIKTGQSVDPRKGGANVDRRNIDDNHYYATDYRLRKLPREEKAS